MKTQSTLRIGYWLSLLSLFLGLAYFGIVIAGLASGHFPPIGWLQALLNAVILISLPVLVLLWVFVHQATPVEKQAFSLGSLLLMVILATVSSINRYNALTVVPQAAAMGVSEGLEWFLPYGWPSVMAAMEVLGFGFYYSLACLCMAPAFGGNKLEKAIFWTLIADGGLSFFGVLSQVLNSIPLTLLAVLAWGPGTILLTVLWALWFKVQEDR